MSELTMIPQTPAKYKKAVGELQKLSSDSNVTVKLDSVKESVTVFKHRVTGEEFNESLNKIQEHLKDIYALDVRFVEEFGQIYSALDSLDREYIKHINVSIKKLVEHNGILETHKQSIDKSFQTLEKVVEKLQKHSSEIEKLRHLQDIDLLWNEHGESKKSIKLLNETMEDCLGAIAQLDRFQDIAKTGLLELRDTTQILTDEINILESFKDALEQNEHILDIDILWKTAQECKVELDAVMVDIRQITDCMGKANESLADLFQFKNALEQNEHVMDIDVLWTVVQNNTAEIDTTKGSIQELIRHSNDVDQQLLTVEQRMDSIDVHDLVMDEKLEEMQADFENLQNMESDRYQLLCRRLITSYVLGGSSIAIAIIIIILSIMEII